MADKRISELPPVDAIDGTEQVPVVQGVVTRRATPAALLVGAVIPGRLAVQDAPQLSTDIVRKVELDAVQAAAESLNPATQRYVDQKLAALDKEGKLPASPILDHDDSYWNICRNPDGLFAARRDDSRRTLRDEGFATTNAVKETHPLLANEPFDLDASVTWAAHQERVRAARRNGSVMGARITAPAGQFFQNRTVWYPAAFEGGSNFYPGSTDKQELMSLGQYPGEINLVGSGMGNTRFICGKDSDPEWRFNGRSYDQIKADCLAAQFTPHCMFDIGRPGFNDRFTGGEGGAGLFAEFVCEGPGGNYGFYHTPHAWVSGIGWTSRRRMSNISVSHFRYGVTRTGDQTGWYNVRGSGNYYTLYYDHPNPVSFGDDSYYDCKFSGWKAGIGVHPKAVAGKAQFHMCGWFTSPYGWWKDIDPDLVDSNGDFLKVWSGIWLHEPQFEALAYGALSGGLANGPNQDPLRDGTRKRYRPFVQDSHIVAPQIGPFDSSRAFPANAGADHQRTAWFDLSGTVGGFRIDNWHETHTVQPGEEALFKIDNPRNFSVTDTQLDLIFDQLGGKPFLRHAGNGFNRGEAPYLEAKNRAWWGWYRQHDGSEIGQYDAVEIWGSRIRRSTGDGSGQGMGVVALPPYDQDSAFVKEGGIARVNLDAGVTNAPGKLRFGPNGKAIRGGNGDALGMMNDIMNVGAPQQMADVQLAGA